MLREAHIWGRLLKLNPRTATARSLLVGAVAVLALLKAPACSGKDDSSDDGGPVEEPPPPTGQVDVTVNFPSDRDETAIAALHLWVLRPEADADVTCARLVGGDVSPHDVSMRQQADVVSTDTDASLVDESVGVGPAIIYVEGVDYRDEVRLAGCDQSAEITENSTTTVTVVLEPARVYDCDDPATEDGAPCDDGDFCTVGDTCEGGECERGVERDCAHLEDECNVGSCDSERGCYRDPLPDGDPCDDGLVCTEDSACNSGRCEGIPINCAAGLEECQISLGCEETYGGCITEYAPSGTACEDGDLCTENDYCDSGYCYTGNQVDCSSLTDQCNMGSCDSMTGECVATPYAAGTYCDDGLMCTESDSCDGEGNCVGGDPPDCTYYDSGCYVGECVEGYGCQQAPAPNNTPCNDGQACTTIDVCDGSGNCLGTSPFDCSSYTDQCNTGVCTEPLGTCQALPNTGTSCDDGLACTANDTCDATGACVGTAVTCTGACDTGVCVEPTGCEPRPEGSVCYLTCNGTCNAAGTCVLGTNAPEGTLCGLPSECNMTCDAAGSCVVANAADGTPCDDGNAATSNDQCTSGVCAGT